jgi:hypothetical protein
MKTPVNKGRNAPNTERHCQRASNHNVTGGLNIGDLLKDIVKERFSTYLFVEYEEKIMLSILHSMLDSNTSGAKC